MQSRAHSGLRMLALLAALLVFGGIAVAGHWYLLSRLVLAPELPPAATRALVAIVVLLGSTLVAQPLGERLLPRRIGRLLAWPASCWLGVAFLLLMASLASELLLLLLAASVDGSLASSVLAARVRAVTIVALVLPTALIALRQGLARPGVRRLTIELARWPEQASGFRIVQISDIHIGSLFGAELARFISEQVMALEPDLIAITGDLVDGPVAQLAGEVAPFAALSAPHGVYFVTGNHDHYSGASAWVDEIARLGIRVLRNERVTLDVAGARIELAGVDDYRSKHLPGERGADLERALAGADPAAPIVLLSHDPSTFAEAAHLGVDLQLSGHTHGGQIWPFNYFVRIAMPWVAGLYRLRGAQLYVSRGTGSWGPPMRLRSPAEIGELTLYRAA